MKQFKCQLSQMLFFFVQFVVSKYVAIDIGSKYSKVSAFEPYGTIEILKDPQDNMWTPSAVALQMKNYPKSRLNSLELLESSVVYGKNALKFLKKHNYSGSSSIPFHIGRNISTPLQIATHSDLLSLLITYLTSSQQNVQGMMLSIPYYYTYSQRQSIIDAVWGTRISFYGLIDDVQAIASYYSTMFAKRFLSDPIAVLFVDIGAYSCKAYRVEFYFDENRKLHANHTSYEWTEDAGGDIFVSIISQSHRISRKRSLNYLDQYQNDHTEELLHESLSSLSSVIRRSINGDIDEIQVFGGSSRYQCVLNTIQSASGDVPIKKEIPVNFGVATGSGHFFQNLLNVSNSIEPNITLTSPYNMFIECDGVTQEYCSKNGKCDNSILLEDAYCDVISIRTEESQTPDGCDDIISRFKLVNISSFNTDHSVKCTGFLMLQPPIPQINGAMWCRNKDMYCDQIKVEQEIGDLFQQKQIRVFNDIVSMNSKKKKKTSVLIGKLSLKIDMIEYHILNNYNLKIERVLDEANILIESAKKLLVDSSSTSYQIKAMIKELESIISFLGLRTEHEL